MKIFKKGLIIVLGLEIIGGGAVVLLEFAGLRALKPAVQIAAPLPVIKPAVQMAAPQVISDEAKLPVTKPSVKAALTADDIAGSGDEIARAEAEGKPAIDVDQVSKDLARSVKALDAALNSLMGTEPMTKLQTLLAAVPQIEGEYKAARRDGKDAFFLRSIAQHYADTLDQLYFLWNSTAFNDMRPEYVNVAEAALKLSQKEKWEAVEKILQPVADWQKSTHSWDNAYLFVVSEAERSVAKKKEAGEPAGDDVRQHELLKYAVVNLERISSY